MGMSAGASTTPEGSAAAPASVLTQSELEDRVANAFIDSLDGSEDPKRQEAPQEDTADAPDDESTEADDGDTGEPEADDAEEAEDDAEDDSESDDQEDEAKPAKKQPGDDVKVRLDDGQEVTLRQLKAGFMMQADYTRKTQTLADKVRAVESERATLNQAAQQQQQAFEVAATLIQEQMPPVPDTALIQTNPQLYLQQQALREQSLQKLHQLAQARQENEGLLAQEAKRMEKQRQEELAKIRDEEQELLMQKLPRLRDQKAMESFVKDALEIGGRKWGITREQLANILSHQEALILHAALNWEKSQSAKMKAVAEAKKAPPLRPAPRAAPGQRTKAKKAEAVAVLKNPGSTEDARMAAAMASLDDRLF